MKRPTRRAFLQLTALAVGGLATARLTPLAAAPLCQPTPGDAFPLTIPFMLGGDCDPAATPTAPPPPTATPWRVWLPQVGQQEPQRRTR